MDYKKSIQHRDFDSIAPILLDIKSNSSDKQLPAKSYGLLWSIAFLLFIIAVFVFIWMPIFVNNNVDKKDIILNASDNSNISIDRTKKSSPWQEAQWSKQRKAAQQKLGDLLEKQDSLEKKSIDKWGLKSYEDTFLLAKRGDQLYREKNYRQAEIFYDKADKVLLYLLNESKNIFERSIFIGKQSILENDSVEAIKAFSLALAINPDNPDAIKGLNRSKNIEKVLSMKKEGELLEKNGHLDKALTLYQKVQALDPESDIVSNLINGVNKKIQKNSFNMAMAEGYQQLQSGQFEKAKKQFSIALKKASLSASKQEAKTAIEDTISQQALYKIAKQRKIAKEHESSERWQQAYLSYKAILAIDSNLNFAKKRLAYSQQQLLLDNELLDIINNPERLSDGGVYQQAVDVYRKAVINPRTGSRLIQQRDTLRLLLKQAVTPISITLQSDDQTDITVYRVAHIGSFTQHTLRLKPGKYTVVGSRNGYRDVYQEFQVLSGQPLSPIVIKCREKIL